ncbi:flagellar hook-associated protein 2 [Clostridium homopropionicum DSM 5847]|uniref:Flagellar hook-associated protein 2 n=1 Tax=Clostridium homopropionicum DSM 5847 TaxID=1121318 RepID=A0A0L6ZE02_9CLOT|nr:flagellar filament capping protein FliD [Clostridium homopropionicum]KOA21043.1 flagellar hook-associated protein 2 [Clostridium homopropionicum DSM 5847]SFF98681.1 flagellar hook-associated protein 2 [Clostridium homopropionicum]
MSNMLRITGMATGMDTDNTVKQLLSPYNARLDKVKQDKQILQWKQEIYRDLLGAMNVFQSSYFDVLKPDTYMLSSNSYNTFDTTYPTSTDSAIVTAVGGSGALNGNYIVKDITLAKTASTTNDGVIQTIKQATSNVAIKPVIDDSNKTLNVNGTDITIDKATYDSMSALATNINSKLKSAGITNVSAQVATDGTGIKFAPIKVLHEDDPDTTAINEDETQTITIFVDGHDYEVQLKPGNYTMQQMADSINTQIGNIKDATTGERLIVDKVQAKAIYDGTNSKLIFEKLNATSSVTITNGTVNDYVIDDTHKDPGLTWNSIALTVTGKNGDGTTNIADNNSDAKDTMKFKIKIDDSNKTLTFNFAGTTKTITLDSGDYDLGNDTTGLIKAINDKIGADTDKIKAQLSWDGNKIEFVNTSPSSQVTVNGTAMTTLGFPSSTTQIYPSSYDKMAGLLSSNSSGILSFTVNGKKITYNFSGADKNKSINDILNDISAKADVKTSYSEISRKFTIESSNTGANQELKIEWNDSDTSSKNFLNSIFGVTGTGSYLKNGSDAIVTIKDPKGNSSTIYQSKNNFTVDGVTYNLLQDTHSSDPNKEMTITLTQNSTKAFDKIKDFVSKYNDIIDKINTKLTEKYDRNYKPLTDDQKEDMKEDEIKQWEEKAKQGLLKNDSDLQNMMYSLRSAVNKSVEGVGITLSDIGISVSSDYMSGGKLVIDETKLKSELSNKGDQIARLFTKSSTSQPIYSASLTQDQRLTRNSEEGVLQSINDILKDYTRTMDGKGSLVQKAGIKGDRSELDNLLSDQVKEKDKIIKEMIASISEKEDRYYKQFASLEAYMNQMNAQSAWLAQQLGTSSN